MKLFEVDLSIVNNIIKALDLKQGRSNSKNSSATMPWSELKQTIKNISGDELAIDYKIFDPIYQNQENQKKLKPYVQNYNDEGIILNTDKEIKKPSDEFDLGTAPTVQQMASRAARRSIQ